MRNDQESAELRLSYGELGLWLFQAMYPQSVAYNSGVALRLRGALDRDALRVSLAALAARHRGLRTTYVSAGPSPERRVAPQPLGELVVTEVGQIDDQELERRVHAAVSQPYDLSSGPLWRPQLFVRSATEALLLLGFHQLIMDGFSGTALLRDLWQLYGATVEGREAELPALPDTYEGFVRWQRDLVQSDAGQQMWAFWKEQLGGDLPVLGLVADKQRPAVPGHAKAVVLQPLPAELCQQLRSHASERGATTYAVVLTAYAALLARHSRQSEVIIGGNSVGSTFETYKDVVGYFNNPLPLRIDLSQDPSFDEALLGAKQVLLSAMDGADYPFPLLADKLTGGVRGSHNPIFQATCTSQKGTTTSGTFELPGLQVEIAYGIDCGHFDCMLELMHTANDGLSLFLQLDGDVYHQATAERMASQLVTLLRHALQTPGQSISSLKLVEAAHRPRLIQQGNHPPQAVAVHEDLVLQFERQVAQRADEVALVDGERTTTYAELNAAANRLANHLRQQGVGAEVRVALHTQRSLEQVIGLLGILKAGACYVPIDPAYPGPRVRFIVQDAAAAVVLTDSSLAQRHDGSEVPVLQLDSLLPRLTEPADNPDGDHDPQRAAYVIYTSGTTGQPKGVVIPHANVVRLFQATEPWFHFGPHDTWTLFHSVAFDFSVWELWGALLYGGRLVVVPFEVSRDAHAFYRLLLRERVTVLNQTPSAFQQLVAVDGEQAAHGADLALRVVVFGGEALRAETLAPWAERHGLETPQLVNMYGITETTVHVTYHRVSATDIAQGSRTVGVPLPDLELHVLGSDLEPAPPGVPAELFVGGAGLARGYLGRPNLTAERFVPHPFSEEPGARLYRTGDLGRRRADGEVEHLGRIDHQVQIRGFRVELGEIEAALARHDAVREAAVLTRDVTPGDSRLVAYLVASGNDSPPPAELRAHVAEVLPDYMVPQRFIWLEHLPLTTNGKLDSKRLPDPAAHDVEQPTVVAPRTAVEQAVARIWGEALGVEALGVESDLVACGAHSITVMRAIAKMRRVFGADIPLQAVFERPNVAAIAEAVVQAAPEKAEKLARAYVRLKSLSRAARQRLKEKLPST